jgi:hypothetical protein
MPAAGFWPSWDGMTNQADIFIKHGLPPSDSDRRLRAVLTYLKV